MLRSDGVPVAIETNVWVTDRTFKGMSLPAIRENVLHLPDYDSTGTYTLTYESNGSVPSDTVPPISRVSPLPSASRPYFQVTWSGEDIGSLGQAAAGIAHYDIRVSVDHGDFRDWLTNTTLISATYPGTNGSHFAFYSIAADANRNEESAPGTPDAETTVSLGNLPPLISVTNLVVLNEGETLDLQLVVTDRDQDQLVQVSLGKDAPSGVFLDESSRHLTWTTGEGNGPSTNLVTLIAQDNGFPSLSATGYVTVVVRDCPLRTMDSFGEV